MKTVCWNGNIITMNERQMKAEAFVMENGVFLEIGKNQDMKEKYPDAEWIDLKGQTVMPAFIDAHSHLSSYAGTFMQVSLAGTVSFEDIMKRLKAFADKKQLGAGDWMQANGYDHNSLQEKKHPSGKMLDEAFPNMCIVLQHQSGHFGVFSSAALKATGMQGKDRNGYLEENDYVEAIKKVPMSSPKEMTLAYENAMHAYASYGITTIQEGMMVKQMIPMYRMLLDNRVLFLDTVGYPQIQDAELFYQEFPECDGKYRNNFKLGGYKMILDGSPQGRTAWMKTPYSGSDNEYGVSSMNDAEVTAAVRTAVKNHRQILAHCNGDRAAEQLLTCAVRAASEEQLREIHPVLVHGQLLAVDQLPRVKQYGIIPSFFIAHCYYWGDVHIQNFGPERAQKISPAGSALALGIPFTFHQDTPVVEPDMMRTVWCAVNRMTKNGVLLGKEERIPVKEALKAVTVNAAAQYGEAERKGSIESGKNADFIVLSEDPMKCDPMKLCDIKVLETYRNEKCIYKRT